MYRPVKPPATSALAPTTIPPFVVPPRSRAARPLALVLNSLNALKFYYKDSVVEKHGNSSGLKDNWRGKIRAKVGGKVKGR